jgi:LPS export ABC transporter permease LptG/LPS export ABC transporter permease LptF
MVMLRIFDRYVIREILPPAVLGLVVFTFVLEIPPIITQGEKLIAKGASWDVVSRILVTLLPQALGITIPVALLIGILIAFGRLSGDREAVALQACGVNLARLLRPVGLLAVLAWAATSYIMIVAVPDANQAFRELTFKVVSTRAESEVKPRVFFEDFPNLVLYVREVATGVGWTDVMVADTSASDGPTIYLARRGRVLLDATRRTVQMVLEDGTTHSVALRQPDRYQVTSFQQVILALDPEAVFPREGPLKGDREMTIAELSARIDEQQRQGLSARNQIMAIQQKFSIPVACLVFAVIGLALGVTNRRDGKLASFVLGAAVVFVYYVLMYMGQSLAKGDMVPAGLAMWLPDIVLGIFGVGLLLRRTQSADRPIRIPLPFPRRRTVAPSPEAPDGAARAGAGAGPRVVLVIRIPQWSVPRPRILDWYTMRMCLHVALLAGAALLGLFYISTFIDLSDKLFRGTTTGGMILHFMWFATPQFVYYVIPIAVLIGTLVTIGALTKNTEIVVMKACGISLYRASVPLLLLAAAASAVLLGLEERVLAYSNRRAETINQVIRGRLPRTYDVLNRRWIVARNGDIYNYVYFDSARNALTGLSIYEFDPRSHALARRTYAAEAVYEGPAASSELVPWRGRQGWQWQMAPKMRYTAFADHSLTLESPTYFGTEQPDAEQMTYWQLKAYVSELQASGFNVVPYVVDLHRKLAFPFVTMIMALIAVPFAVTTGKRGALYGIGAGIALAILYWTTISVFAAVGRGGLMAPALAAWAPNVLFGAVAAYLLLTART